MAAAFAASDPRVRVLRLERPHGVVAARNALLAASSAPYVAFLDADDAYLPGGLAAQVAALERSADVVLVHGGAEIVEESGAGAAAVAASLRSRRRRGRPRCVRGAAAVERAGHLDGRRPPLGASRRRRLRPRRPLQLRLGPVVADGAPRRRRLPRRAGRALPPTPREHLPRHDRQRRPPALRRARRAPSTAHLSPRIPWRKGQWSRRARSALAAKALLHAGDAQTRGERAAALRALALAARERPDLLGTGLARLALAVARGDEYAAFTS